MLRFGSRIFLVWNPKAKRRTRARRSQKHDPLLSHPLPLRGLSGQCFVLLLPSPSIDECRLRRELSRTIVDY